MRFSFLCVILFLVNTCENAKTVRKAELNREFQLKFRESAKLESEDLGIRFNALIQESRCPKEVQCITAGKAEIAIQMTDAEGKTEQIQMSTEVPANEVSYDKYRIQLLEVLPYPIAGERNDPERYSILLIISARDDGQSSRS